MRKAKILFLTRWFPDDTHPVRCVFVQRMLDALSATHGKYLYTAISTVPYFPRCILRLFPHWAQKCGGPEYEISPFGYEVFRPTYFKLPYPLLFKWEWRSYFTAVLSLIRRKGLSFDLIHTHGLYPDAYVAVKIGDVLGIPVITHAHDSFIREHVFGKHKNELDMVMEKSHLVIAVSDFQNKTLTTLYPSCSSKIITVYNGVDTSKFVLPNGFSCVKLDPCRLIYIGNINKQKRVDMLIRAMKSVSLLMHVTLDIYGAGPELANCKQLSKEMRVDNIVFFKETIDNGKLPDILPTYSFLIQPSAYETFGIVSVEAMSCGVPVIGFDLTAMREVVQSGTGGILAEANTQEGLVQAIIAATDHQWDRNKIRNYAINNFSITKNVELIQTLYDRTLL